MKRHIKTFGVIILTLGFILTACGMASAEETWGQWARRKAGEVKKGIDDFVSDVGERSEQQQEEWENDPVGKTAEVGVGEALGPVGTAIDLGTAVATGDCPGVVDAVVGEGAGRAVPYPGSGEILAPITGEIGERVSDVICGEEGSTETEGPPAPTATLTPSPTPTPTPTPAPAPQMSQNTGSSNREKLGGMSTMGPHSRLNQRGGQSSAHQRQSMDRRTPSAGRASRGGRASCGRSCAPPSPPACRGCR